MKYLTESQVNKINMNIEIITDKIAKLMVENPEYGLFDFIYGIRLSRKQIWN